MSSEFSRDGVFYAVPAVAAVIVGSCLIAGFWGQNPAAVPVPQTAPPSVSAVLQQEQAVGSDSGAVADSPEDAAWPPVPVGDPDPVTITIPESWSEADKATAREWVAVEQSTRTCALAHGIDYRFFPVWDVPLDEAGNPLGDPVPPTDWESHFQRPFMHFLDSTVVCFDRALVSVGRTASGPLEFAPRLPRFEESDFADSETLDIPEDWSDQQRSDARREWSAELITRQCMAESGFPQYGQPPSWLMTDQLRAEDPWESVLTPDQWEAARKTLNGSDGNTPYDWEQAGCFGRGQHDAATVN